MKKCWFLLIVCLLWMNVSSVNAGNLGFFVLKSFQMPLSEVVLSKIQKTELSQKTFSGEVKKEIKQIDKSAKNINNNVKLADVVPTVGGQDMKSTDLSGWTSFDCEYEIPIE